MCCSLHRMPGIFIRTDILIKTEDPKVYEDKKKQKLELRIKGYLDFTPKNLAERCVRLFQGIERIEKLLEILDEAWHGGSSLVQSYLNLETFQFLEDLHFGAHHFEHALHACCFFGDLTRIWAKKFFAKHDGKLQKTAKVFHAFSHLLATYDLGCDLKIVPSPNSSDILTRCRNLTSAIGHGLLFISLIWERCQGSSVHHRKYFLSDLTIQGSGFIYQTFSLGREYKIFSNLSYINKIIAISGIIHAIGVYLRLSSPDKEKVVVDLPVSEVKKIIANDGNNTNRLQVS